MTAAENFWNVFRLDAQSSTSTSPRASQATHDSMPAMNGGSRIGAVAEEGSGTLAVRLARAA